MATFSYVSVAQKRKFIYSEAEPPRGGICDGHFLRLPTTGEVSVQPNFQNYNEPRANGSMILSVRHTKYQSLDSSGSCDATQDSYGSLNAAVNRHFWSFSNSESSHILDTSFEDHSACEIRKKLEELEKELLDDNVNKEIEDCQDICGSAYVFGFEFNLALTETRGWTVGPPLKKILALPLGMVDRRQRQRFPGIDTRIH
ncbi:hypothetical protein EJ110_NYTH50524 [Nymphaea thermarum]|nr:hypothetical protein EJ110_NYTH50524 [Nymphaea thermarum]